MGAYDTVVGFFQDGGVFMYPIVLVLAIGIAIAVERFMFLSFAGINSRRTWGKITPLLQSGRLNEAADVARGSKSAVGNVLSYGFERIKTARRRDDIEKAMEESMLDVMPRLEKRTHYLATFANMATLLGLLGTIIGLIRAFTAVAAASPAEKADMLSASISVAMNTTAFGLMAAIPLLLIHTVLQTKTTELIDTLEMAAVKFLNIVTEKQQRAAGAAA